MTDSQLGTGGRDAVVPFNHLSTSYRFDSQLATLLTAFQYAADDVELTAAEATRPVPSDVVDAPTPGVAAALGGDASLALVVYSDRGYRMVNPIETAIIATLADALSLPDDARRAGRDTSGSNCTFGVVTPHNAQRGLLTEELPGSVTANTVEQYQGDQRDIIAVSGTVADPAFARRENRFLLDPRRLLVAISRSKLLTVVVCSDALFELVPRDPDRLDDGPVWARLFTLAAGRDPTPSWAGTLGEFTPRSVDDPAVPLAVYPSLSAP